MVRDFDAALRRHTSEVRDYTYAFHRRWARRGVTTIRGTGWALRPFLLPAARLDFIAATFHAAIVALRNAMREAGVAGKVAKLLPCHPGIDELVDVVDGVWSPAFTAHLRPDGYLFEDRFVLAELNYGNGVLVSCGYTEAVADYWRRHPVVRRLGWDVDRLHRRPFPWLLNLVRRFARPVQRPRVALFAHSSEWAVVMGYPKRVVDQMRFAKEELTRAGMPARIVSESDLVLDRRGNLRFESDGASVDLLMFITVGTTFLDCPELMLPGGALAHYGKARIGDVWVLKPLAGLAVDKCAMPFLGTLKFPRSMPDGFRFEVAHTEVPFGKRPSRYLRDQVGWVIKRAYDGKDTNIGIVKSAAEWGDVVSDAVEGHHYVAQRYESLPKAEVPVFVDEKHLEWVKSRVELSTFVFDGAFGGAAGRHAPDAEGLVMTDPPKDYGYSTVFLT